MNIDVEPLVLIVEDSEDDAFFLERTLGRTGLPCRRQYLRNGGEAVEYLKAHSDTPERDRPVVIFLDLKMPVLNGFDVLQWIAENAPAKWDVVILSGSDQASDVEAARQLGANGYLVKPAGKDELRTCLLPRFHRWSQKQNPPAEVAFPPAIAPV